MLDENEEKDGEEDDDEDGEKVTEEVPNSSDPITYFDFNPSSSKRAIRCIVISCNWSCLIRASGLKGLVHCFLRLNPIFCRMNQ